MKILKFAMLFSTVAVLTTALNAGAGGSPVSSPSFAVLSQATPIELPAKSAELVLAADAKQRQQTTIDVVRAAVPLNPAAAPAIVGSISQSCPDMAATAAGTAVSLVPDQGTVIARAAAAAAPAKAGQIVEAICRVLPQDYQKVADAVAEVVPGAGKEILTGVSTAIPTLKSSINQALAGDNGNVPAVASVLDQVKPDVQVATTTPLTPATMNAPSLAPVTVGPPYVPFTGTPSDVDPGSGGQVPTGGRNYASP